MKIKYLITGVFALFVFTCAAGDTGSWSPSADIAYHARAQSSSSSSEQNSVFPAFLAAAMQSRIYRSNVEKVDSRPCEYWVAVQTIEVQSADYGFSFLCRQHDGQWSLTKGNAHKLGVVTQFIKAGRLDDLVVRAAAIEGQYYVASFDAPCVYVTVFDGAAVTRFAVYSPNTDPQTADGKTANAYTLVRELQGVLRGFAG